MCLYNRSCLSSIQHLKSMKIGLTFLICTVGFCASQAQQNKKPTQAKIIKKGPGFQLFVNQKPYYIKVQWAAIICKNCNNTAAMQFGLAAM